MKFDTAAVETPSRHQPAGPRRNNARGSGSSDTQLIADDPRHVLILSTHLLAEVADVLSRP